MKRGVIAGLILLILMIGSVSALESTRIYGFVDADREVKLTLKYTSNGVSYNQLVVKKANYIGAWEYKLSTDSGTIEAIVSYLGAEKTYSVPTGKDFRIDLFSTGTEEVEVKNATEEKNETPEIAITNLSEKIPAEAVEEEKSLAITGSSIFEKSKNIFNDKKIYLAIAGLFLMIVIANLVSHFIIGMFSGRIPNIGAGENKSYEKIKITKLSEKIAKAQKEIEDAEAELAKAKNSGSQVKIVQ